MAVSGMTSRPAAIFLAGLAGLAGFSSPASAGVNRCADPAILKQIESRFSRAEPARLDPGLEIRQILSPQLRYQVRCEPLALTHDQCSGEAAMSDGSVRGIVYSVQRGFGLASGPERIRFCIDGLWSWEIGSDKCGTPR